MSSLKGERQRDAVMLHCFVLFSGVPRFLPHPYLMGLRVTGMPALWGLFCGS